MHSRLSVPDVGSRGASRQQLWTLGGQGPEQSLSQPPWRLCQSDFPTPQGQSVPGPPAKGSSQLWYGPPSRPLAHTVGWATTGDWQEAWVASRVPGGLPSVWAPQADRAYEKCGRGSSSDFRPLVTLNRTTWRVCVCMQSGGSSWFPCPSLPLGCDSGRCHARHLQAGPTSTLGGGTRRGPSSPAPTVTLGPTPWDLSWKERIFESQLCPMMDRAPDCPEKEENCCLQPGLQPLQMWYPPGLESLEFWSWKVTSNSRLRILTGKR